MYDRMQEMTVQQMEKIHAAAMDLFKNTRAWPLTMKRGLKFSNPTDSGLKAPRSFFEETQIRKALETCTQSLYRPCTKPGKKRGNR